MEAVRLPKLPFGNGRKKGGATRPLKAVQGMKQWAKAQSVMLYGVEHDEIWVHEGFNEVRLLLSERPPSSYLSYTGLCWLGLPMQQAEAIELVESA